MKQFKLRASAAGTLIPNGKGSLISVGGKTYLKEWVISQIYGVEKQIKSKYIDKGVMMEDQAIDLAVKMLNIEFALKNESRFEDDFFTGEPDMILNDMIIDIKNSWDCFTFPLFETEIPNSDYFYQLQVYMHLTGKRKAKLVILVILIVVRAVKPG